MRSDTNMFPCVKGLENGKGRFVVPPPSSDNAKAERRGSPVKSSPDFKQGRGQFKLVCKPLLPNEEYTVEWGREAYYLRFKC